MKPLYIIDFSNFAYKFKSVYKFARVENKGVEVDTSILFGFTKALRENPFQDICIVLDGFPSRSSAALPSYKGQRMHDDEKACISVPKLEVIQYLTSVKDILKKNIFVVCSPLQETDEVIGSIVHRICHKEPPRASFISKLNTRSLSDDKMLSYLCVGSPSLTQLNLSNYDTAVIASTDGDFLQLQRWGNVSIDLSTSGKQISNATTSKSTSDMTPIATIPYKAIYGDTSDNIPTNRISWAKDRVLKTLNSFVTTDETLKDFYNACVTGNCTKLQLQLAQLAKVVHYECCDGFKRNWVVAYLEFRSDPFMISFPDYDINTTITKYKIKVRR